MISRAHIVAWRSNAPWAEYAQVEQDLLLARAMVELFSDETLTTSVAMRGGTALHKLYLRPPARYSEDIDLVQLRQEPIGKTLDAIHARLDPWLGRPTWKQTQGRVTLYYAFETEVERVPRRLKVEINTREHLAVFGLEPRRLAVDNPWYSGTTDVVTYSLEELLATKLRALYGRRRGRDLFDLAHALEREPKLVPERVLQCFDRYLAHAGLRVTRAEMEEDLAAKSHDPRVRRWYRSPAARGSRFRSPAGRSARPEHPDRADGPVTRRGADRIAPRTQS